MRANLAAALSRLLTASLAVDVRTMGVSARDEFQDARDQAARALIMNRAKSGRQYIVEADCQTFFDRWCALRSAAPGDKQLPLTESVE